MKKLGVISSILIIISVFLPWFSSSVSGSGVFNTTVNSQSLTGLTTSYGLLGILLGGVSLFLFIKENKWSFLPGLLSLIDGILFILYLNGFGVTSSSSFGEYSQKYSSSLEPQIGVYLLIVGGFLSVIFSLKYFKPNTYDKTPLTSIKIPLTSILEVLPYILVSVLILLISLSTKIDFIEDNEDVIFFTVLILIIISSIVSGFLNFKSDKKKYIKILKYIPLIVFFGFSCYSIGFNLVRTLM